MKTRSNYNEEQMKKATDEFKLRIQYEGLAPTFCCVFLLYFSQEPKPICFYFVSKEKKINKNWFICVHSCVFSF